MRSNIRNVLVNALFQGIDLAYSLLFLRPKALFFWKHNVEPDQLSDSQRTIYEYVVARAIKKKPAFENFRRNVFYCRIVETVTPSQGNLYLQKIEKNHPSLLNHISEIQKNDSVGNPKLFRFHDYGHISPTTLRYAAVAAELQTLFGSLKNFAVAEIGVGYGGQLRILDYLSSIRKYYCFDLDIVQKLSARYLESFQLNCQVEYPQIDDYRIREFDLVVSNYAFSELTMKDQEWYLKRVLTQSSRGYLTMNSGNGSSGATMINRMKVEEILDSIPNARVIEEAPRTGESNYIIVWGESQNLV